MTHTHTHTYRPQPIGGRDAQNIPRHEMRCDCGERPADAALRRHTAKTRTTE